MREQGQICSHSFHDVAGVEDVTIIVQRGYSLTLDVQEGLSSWEGLLICSNIMGDAFDILHVKDWSYELMGAYFHRPIALSLWSWDLLMEYSQDHFSFDALGEQRGGEEDDVVDGDIYYCDVLLLT